MLGWMCIGLGAAMLLLFGFCLYYILPLLTQPPGFVDDYLKRASDVDASFLVALQYESYAIRTQGIQIALGFLVGILMGAFGLLLFSIGATDAIDFDGTFKEAKLSLKSTAPGLVVMVVSGIIICFSVTRDVKRTFDATYNQGKGVKIENRALDVPSPPFTEDRKDHK